MGKGYLYFRAGATTQERDRQLQQENIAAIIHHSANQIRFDDAQPANLLPHGQAFGPDAELRWRPDGSGQWELLLISEKCRSALSQTSWQETILDVDEKETSIFLWGKHWQSLEGADENNPALQGWGWVQAQIKADLHYPVTGSAKKPIVRVAARTYRQQGVVRLTRFVSMKPVKDEEA